MSQRRSRFSSFPEALLIRTILGLLTGIILIATYQLLGKHPDTETAFLLVLGALTGSYIILMMSDAPALRRAQRERRQRDDEFRLRQQRMIEARTWTYELVGLTEPATDYGNFQLQFQPRGLTLSTPLIEAVAPNQVYRAFANTENPTVMWPKLQMDSTGTVQSFGPVAVVSGPNVPAELPVWEDDQLRESRELARLQVVPLLWQIPADRQPKF